MESSKRKNRGVVNSMKINWIRMNWIVKRYAAGEEPGVAGGFWSECAASQRVAKPMKKEEGWRIVEELYENSQSFREGCERIPTEQRERERRKEEGDERAAVVADATIPLVSTVRAPIPYRFSLPLPLHLYDLGKRGQTAIIDEPAVL